MCSRGTATATAAMPAASRSIPLRHTYAGVDCNDSQELPISPRFDETAPWSCPIHMQSPAIGRSPLIIQHRAAVPPPFSTLNRELPSPAGRWGKRLSSPLDQWSLHIPQVGTTRGMTWGPCEYFLYPTPQWAPLAEILSRGGPPFPTLSLTHPSVPFHCTGSSPTSPLYCDNESP